MKTIQKMLNLLALVAFSGMLTHCANDKVAGNTSETGNAAVRGTLHFENGLPAKNAEVRLITADHAPGPNLSRTSAIISTVYTDDQGAYVFDAMPSGFYNIMGKTAGLSAFIDSVYLKPNIKTEVEDGKLKSPGSLHGVVRLQPGDDNRSVLIILFGTDIFTTPVDTTGRFNLTSIPGGTYSARIFTLNTQGTYAPLDTSFNIRSGQMDTLNATIHPRLISLPLVTGLGIRYDSLTVVASLNWNKSTSAVVKGYNIYRMHQDSNYKLLNTQLLTDTSYQDGCSYFLIPDKRYRYKVVCVDAQGNEGAMSEAVEIRISQVYHILDTLLPAGYRRLEMNSAGNIFTYDSTGLLTIYNPSHVQIGQFSTRTRLRDKPSYLMKADASDNAYFAYGYNDSLVYKFNIAGELTDTIFLPFPTDQITIQAIRNDTLFCQSRSRIYLVSATHGAAVNSSFERPAIPNGYGSSYCYAVGIKGDEFLFDDYYSNLIITDFNGKASRTIELSIDGNLVSFTGDTLLFDTYTRLVVQNGFAYAGQDINGNILFKFILMNRNIHVSGQTYIHDGIITALCSDGSVISIGR